MEEKIAIEAALVSVKCNDKFYEIKTLFDTGSTRTYITVDLGKVLKAKPTEQQNFSVYSFGCTKAKEKTSPVVDLAIKIKLGKAIMIEAKDNWPIEADVDSTRKNKEESIRIIL